MRFIDLFCGIGGFRLGMEKSGHECVWSNDINQNCSKIYEKNFGTKPDTRDIREVSTDEIPDHDIICGGFPCQSFSIAGKRGGFEDARGTLFFEITRIARAKKTPYLFLENVKGLLSHDNGKTFETIITTLDELGYDTQWMVFNSKDFGVPQSRERVFIIGNLRALSRPRLFSI
jgi:DNA (cytosine-5)-methyltransferase 1